MLYELKIKVDRTNEKGDIKTISERYITQDELFAGVEAKGLELYNGECDVTDIKRSKITEIINVKEEDKPFFKATLVDTFTDDEGVEKETKYSVLVCAKDVEEATKLMLEHMKQGYDMKLDGIVKTNILDLI